MSDFLLVQAWNHLVKAPGVPPRILEVPVDPAGAPYLVSAREGGPYPVVWVHRANKQGRIRVCPRKDPTLRKSILLEILTAGIEKNLGNVHPLTENGVKDAQSYLQSFGFEDLEAIVAEDVKETHLPDKTNVFVQDWVPPGTLLLVPQDRSYVGVLGELSTGHSIAIVHNPLRGIALVTNDTARMG